MFRDCNFCLPCKYRFKWTQCTPFKWIINKNRTPCSTCTIHMYDIPSSGKLINEKWFHFSFSGFVCVWESSVYFAWFKMTEPVGCIQSVLHSLTHSLSQTQQTKYWDWINQQMEPKWLQNVTKWALGRAKLKNQHYVERHTHITLHSYTQTMVSHWQRIWKLLANKAHKESSFCVC